MIDVLMLTAAVMVPWLLLSANAGGDDRLAVDELWIAVGLTGFLTWGGVVEGDWLSAVLWAGLAGMALHRIARASRPDQLLLVDGGHG